uniref:Uncharacterized protein n=1 Tax=Lepeophtheirus salmonis TaxID=72036 RepID=A0A0K2UJ01_LEPSM
MIWRHIFENMQPLQIFNATISLSKIVISLRRE